MPHIEHKDRSQYDDGLGLVNRALQNKPLGHLTFVLYVIARSWMLNSDAGTLPRYIRRSCTLGALRDAHHELRRHYMDPYEDQKIEENGEAI